VNNFISGLILLAEQKIKVGNVIEADGHLGRMINLGTRCSLNSRLEVGSHERNLAQVLSPGEDA
jgi:small-conductance mechanosensitive channel